ncbi:MAG TPA: hypothetical protein VGA78_11090 [Gemmatimonadales bacterium]|jgi:hypothetical protein
MSRFHYFSVLAWLAAALLVLGGTSAVPAALPAIDPVAITGPEAWFRQVKPSCNSLEVELALRAFPPPESVDGTGYAAACLALAGRIDDARARIIAVEAADRWKAAGIVFDIGHPIADAGDDRSAGPIMGLVTEFWPNHYMALYHAGMANYAIGQPGLARTQLREFLELYQQKDGWRTNALEILERLER